jgi:hypothetical protein
VPGLARLNNLVRTVRTPEFEGVTFHEVLTKSALNHVPETSTMLPGEWTINPYRGCTHACAYCFARPTHEHLGLNMGADFDSQLIVKVSIPDVLRRELAAKRVLPDRVAFGTSTDPYQRAEGRYQLMPPASPSAPSPRVRRSGETSTAFPRPPSGSTSSSACRPRSSTRRCSTRSNRAHPPRQLA